MNKNMKTWIAALRSGNYKQGKLHLRDATDEYCCLGVACDISGLGNWTTHPGGWYEYKVGDTIASTVMHREVMKWLGMTTNTGLFLEEIQYGNQWHSDLVSMNDKGRTFEEIADAIEAHAEVFTSAYPKDREPVYESQNEHKDY